MTHPRTWILAAAVALASGCDYSGDFLFAGVVPGLEDIWVLEAEEGGLLVPAVIATIDDIRPNTIYAEVGPPGTTAYGGVTFEFTGTGGDVCIWVDPEVANWSQAVSPSPAENARKWSYPDNVFDDGDIDLFAGLSVYYTGSPGETIGDFEVAYEDSLGNEIPISLASCPNAIGRFNELASAGRGSPEFCSVVGTDVGISYTVLLRTWSTPLDDDRLSFGLVLADGNCETLRAIASGTPDALTDECLVMGEALTPVEIKGEAPVYYGFDAVADDERIWPRSMEFEAAFCDEGQNMRRFCEQELEDLAAEGLQCERETIEDPDSRCYCGDVNDTPVGGAF